MGVTESILYQNGSISLLNYLLKSGKRIIIGGGDTAGFVNEEKIDLDFELKIKNGQKEFLIAKIIEMQNDYITIDKKFEDEMERYRNRLKYRISILSWLKV
jgi:hypothetical protein